MLHQLLPIFILCGIFGIYTFWNVITFWWHESVRLANDARDEPIEHFITDIEPRPTPFSELMKNK